MADSFRHSLAVKGRNGRVAGLAVAEGLLWGGQLTAEQVPLILSALKPAAAVEPGGIGADGQHRQSACMGCQQHHFIPASCGTVAGDLRREIPTGGGASARAYTRRMEVDRVDAVYDGGHGEREYCNMR